MSPGLKDWLQGREGDAVKDGEKGRMLGGAGWAEGTTLLESIELTQIKFLKKSVTFDLVRLLLGTQP